jgi:hypothetical protein|nr:MAG TPA_asm: hypothetical protein [Caudoviricetes sp.]
MNTLKFQQPKQDVSFNEFDDLYIIKLILEFALWCKFYGYKNKTYQFEVNSAIDLDV